MAALTSSVLLLLTAFRNLLGSPSAANSTSVVSHTWVETPQHQTHAPLLDGHTRCTTHTMIFVVRESKAPPGFGRLERLATDLNDRIPSSTKYSIEYPATVENYTSTLLKGVGMLTFNILDYLKFCEFEGRVVLLGYSQGAHVIAGMLGGLDEVDGNGKALNLSSGTYGLEVRNVPSIRAVVLMGDPSFTANQTFDAGNATTSGVHARQGASLQQLGSYSGVLKSYCDAGDSVCASASIPDQLRIHGAYADKYGKDAEEFIMSRLGGDVS